MSETKHVTKILNGKGLATKLRASLKQQIAHARKQPTLAVLMIGQDPEQPGYQLFLQQAAEAGIFVDTMLMKETVSERKLYKVIEKLNNNKKMHGIMLQLPVPEVFDSRDITAAIAVEKDVDCAHPENLGWLAVAAPRYLPSMTRAIWTMFESAGIDVSGKHAVIIGANNIVGKPTAMQLTNHGATVTLCHSRTEDLAALTKEADIIISATGKPRSITADMLKEDCIVIDVGATKVDDEIVGDVDFDSVSEIASYITPVPDGVPPMTIVSLLQNTYQAMCDQEGIES